MNTHKKNVYLVSSCLTGLCTRYDGKLKKNAECLAVIADNIWIPVCPEQLGGLPTPREAAEIVGGNGMDVLNGDARVITKSGIDVSREFINGAHQVLTIARQQQIDTALLKSGSPSCAVDNIIGVTAALLRLNGIEVTEF